MRFIGNIGNIGNYRKTFDFRHAPAGRVCKRKNGVIFATEKLCRIERVCRSRLEGVCVHADWIYAILCQKASRVRTFYGIHWSTLELTKGILFEDKSSGQEIIGLAQRPPGYCKLSGFLSLGQL